METKEAALAALRPVNPKDIGEVQKQAILHLQIAVEEFNHAIFENAPRGYYRDVAIGALIACKQHCVQAITHAWPKPEGKKNEKENNKDQSKDEKKV